MIINKVIKIFCHVVSVENPKKIKMQIQNSKKDF